MDNKRNINKKKIFIAIVIIIFIIYIFYMSYLLIGDETDTFIVKEGTLYKEETVAGYIIRDETVIEKNDNQNNIIPIIGEGEKVSKSSSVFQYYNVNQDEIEEKINQIDIELQSILKTENHTVTSEIKLLENQIESKVEILRELNNTQEISEINKEIQDILEKKIEFIGSSNNSSTHVKELISQRKKYEEELSNNALYATAPVSGILSYKVDGLETLCSSNFEELSTEYLESLNLKTGQIIATSETEGKIIDGFKCYLAVSMDSKDAMSANVRRQANN